MAITKSIEFFAPYIVSELNDKTKRVFNINGVLSGGAITVNSAVEISIAPYVFVQNGLVVEQDAATTQAVPDYTADTRDIFVLVSSPDAQATTGVTITVAYTAQNISTSSVVIGARVANKWSLPPRLSTQALEEASRVLSRNGEAKIIKGLDIDFQRAYGTAQAATIAQGSARDGSGQVHQFDVDISIPLGFVVHAVLEAPHIDQHFYRQDYIMLRKGKDIFGVPPKLEYVAGPTFKPASTSLFEAPASGATVQVESAVGNSSPSLSVHEDGSYIAAWANGTKLRLNQLAHTAARAIGTRDENDPGDIITGVCLATPPNKTASDRHYGVYAVGPDIGIFRTNLAGTTIADAITITSGFANSCSAPHMIVDEFDYAHIVFQHEENSNPATPNNQVYYIKYNLNDWAGPLAADVPARIARGLNNGSNDTQPKVAIDNDGGINIVFVQGSTGTALTTGPIILCELSVTGPTVTIVAAGSIISSDVQDGNGTAITPAPTDCTKPDIISTIHGEVYVSWFSASETGIFLYHSSFEAKTGFQATKTETVTGTQLSQNLFQDKLGRLFCFSLTDDAGTCAYNLSCFNTELFALGKILSEISGRGLAPVANNQILAQALIDLDGSINIVGVDTGGIVTHYKLSSGSTASRQPSIHSLDAILAAVTIPFSAGNDLAHRKDAMEHGARGAKDNYPIVAGHKGDYMGFNSIAEAVESLRGIGGKVVIRGGVHHIYSTIEVPSGVELEGAGNVILFPHSCDCLEIAGSSGTITSVDSTTKTVVLNSVSAQYARPGDAVFLYNNDNSKPLGSAYLSVFYINKVVDIKTIVLNDVPSIGGWGTPSAVIFKTGIALKNLTIEGSDFTVGNKAINANYLAHSAIENVTVMGAATSSDPVLFDNLYEVSFNGFSSAGTSSAAKYQATLIKLIGVSLNGCHFWGAPTPDLEWVHFGGYERLTVSGCHNDATWKFNVVAGTTPVWVNNSGLVDVTIFDTISSWGMGAKTFIETLVLNQNAAALTAGHVRGKMIPTVDDTELGSSSKRWKGYFGDINIDGNIDGNLVLPTGDVQLATGDVQLATGDINVDDGTVASINLGSSAAVDGRSADDNGIYGKTESTWAVAGVYGESSNAAGSAKGIHGESATLGAGVYGENTKATPGGFGLHGASAALCGVRGEATSGIGGWFTGTTTGSHGETSADATSAGVYGKATSVADPTSATTAGVRGENLGLGPGVEGINAERGVVGSGFQFQTGTVLYYNVPLINAIPQSAGIHPNQYPVWDIYFAEPTSFNYALTDPYSSPYLTNNTVDARVLFKTNDFPAGFVLTEIKIDWECADSGTMYMTATRILDDGGGSPTIQKLNSSDGANVISTTSTIRTQTPMTCNNLNTFNKAGTTNSEWLEIQVKATNYASPDDRIYGIRLKGTVINVSNFRTT